LGVVAQACYSKGKGFSSESLVNLNGSFDAACTTARAVVIKFVLCRSLINAANTVSNQVTALQKARTDLGKALVKAEALHDDIVAQGELISTAGREAMDAVRAASDAAALVAASVALDDAALAAADDAEANPCASSLAASAATTEAAAAVALTDGSTGGAALALRSMAAPGAHGTADGVNVYAASGVVYTHPNGGTASALLRAADIGSTVQAYDATLTSLALLGTAADKIAYTTAADTWAETAITAAGRAILDDADAAASTSDRS
jgi:hypothetical protein